MDLPDDIAGRVAIFSVDPGTDLSPRLPADRAPTGRGPFERLLVLLGDDPRGIGIVAVALVIVLVVGLAVTR